MRGWSIARLVAGAAGLVLATAAGCEEAREKASAVEASAREEGARLEAGARELGAGTLELLREQRADADGQIERVIARGEQVVPVATEIVRLYNETFQGKTRVEPIYQPIGEGDDAAALTDVAIGQMPRVEVIDGVTVGFKDLVQTDTHGRTTERAVLVTWRRGDHLVGFVYHSEERIDLEALVRDAPKLIALVEQAAASDG